MLEVYMDDMIVKSKEEVDHTAHLKKVFTRARQCKMRFNPEKCTFGVRAGKFLGFYLTERGIEANPDKCRAFTEFPTPDSKKSIQSLNGMLTSLSRFVAKSAQHALPLFRLLRKESAFEWTAECEEALQHLKKALSEPPVLSRPEVDETLYVYLAVSTEAVSAALIRETTEGQKPVYFTSKALQGPEVRYQQIEKVALALVIAARRLRQYFLAHTIVVRTDQPIKALLARPDMVGRMLKWSVELSEFDIRYESRKALKAQTLADFVAEMTPSTVPNSEADKWTIFVDEASNATGAGAGIILENGAGTIIEVSLTLSFPTTNNQAEYEAFLTGLRLAKDVGAREVKIFTDSQLVASQVLGQYQAKDDNLQEYLRLVQEMVALFDSIDVKHVPRGDNTRADILSKLASTKRKKGGNKSVIQEILPHPSIKERTPQTLTVMDIDTDSPNDGTSWMTKYYDYLAYGCLPKDEKEAKAIQRKAPSYCLMRDKLYRRGLSDPLLRCIGENEVDYILREVHEGINGQHPGGKSLAKKILRAGYYWSTMQQDAKDHVKKCDTCQRHADMILAPPKPLNTLSSPWPFAWWGMDILGPFTTGLHGGKYLIVGVDYFTKWVEAEAIPNIAAVTILRFFKRNILARFGIPQVVVTDNGTQFTDKNFQEFLAAIKTKQHFTSVEHPQTNGQAESANRVILRGLKRRLEEGKDKWVEELWSVRWAYRTTPHSTTGETPFRLTYGTEAVIPVEVEELTWRTTQPLSNEENNAAIREELDLVEELRTAASLREASLKQKVAARHDLKVIKREFDVGSLVLRRNAKDTHHGKLAANWEGPYRVRAKTDHSGYHIETLDGKQLQRTWNAKKLKQYYS
jgi:ribonuclease HI